MKRTVALILFAAFLVSPLPAQTKRQKERPFVVALQWSAQAQFAGYYVAKEKGFYQAEGIDVLLSHPFVTASTEERALADSVDAMVLPLVEALEIVDKGMPLTNILQTSMNSGTMLISRYGNDPMQLGGRAKIATWRAGFSQIPYCVVKEKGLDYEGIPSATIVNIFVAGAVDACLAMSYNEYYQILQAGLIRDPKAVYRFSEQGYNIQEDGVYLTRRRWNKDRDRAERFARASRKGWEWAVAHPQETLEIVMRYIADNRIATNRTLQRLMLEETLRLQLDPDSGQRDFRLRPDMVRQASGMMHKAGLLEREIGYEELVP
ncbi:MAG: ABC transporter substrate-binding protein [Bacteroidales bacterium]|nr:ABC transporter substrate-binding protein [Bacteroidales bacterium]